MRPNVSETDAGISFLIKVGKLRLYDKNDDNHFFKSAMYEKAMVLFTNSKIMADNRGQSAEMFLSGCSDCRIYGGKETSPKEAETFSSMNKLIACTSSTEAVISVYILQFEIFPKSVVVCKRCRSLCQMNDEIISCGNNCFKARTMKSRKRKIGKMRALQNACLEAQQTGDVIDDDLEFQHTSFRILVGDSRDSLKNLSVIVSAADAREICFNLPPRYMIQHEVVQDIVQIFTDPRNSKVKLKINYCYQSRGENATGKLISLDFY